MCLNRHSLPFPSLTPQDFQKQMEMNVTFASEAAPPSSVSSAAQPRTRCSPGTEDGPVLLCNPLLLVNHELYTRGLKQTYKLFPQASHVTFDWTFYAVHVFRFGLFPAVNGSQMATRIIQHAELIKFISQDIVTA